MYFRTGKVLVMSLCLLVGIAACRQLSRSDQPVTSSTETRQTRDAQPEWTIAWSQIKTGMDPAEILSLLDEPRHVKITKINTAWYYSDRRAEGPYVMFDTRQMRVERWRAPGGR
ncbi:MAG: hypothetical protein ABIG44_06985 [Planctomycetota bacterium]